MKNRTQNLKPFKKGISGNPLGKPVGTLSSSTIIRRWLDSKSKLENPLTGEKIRMSHYDAVILAQIAKALKADTPAFKELMDRLEGKAMQRIEAEVRNETLNIEVPSETRDAIIKKFRDDY